MDLGAFEAWLRERVEPAGPLEVVHDRPWALVCRVPLADRIAWFKACAPIQRFEPRLTADLYARWPDRVAEVLAHDDDRGWLLVADAGTSVGELGMPPEVWRAALPPYAELQRGEAAHAGDHLAHGVPDLRLATLPARYDELLRLDLPLEPDELRRLRDFAPRFAALCDELAACGVPETIQHDDLHHGNLFSKAGHLRVIDWGDASIAHPFASLVVMFRFLEERGKLAPGDPWFARLRDAYLEPWGPGLDEAFALALRVGAVARSLAYMRLRPVMSPEWRPRFETDFALVLRRALAHAIG